MICHYEIFRLPNHMEQEAIDRVFEHFDMIFWTLDWMTL